MFNVKLILAIIYFPKVVEKIVLYNRLTIVISG